VTIVVTVRRRTWITALYHSIGKTKTALTT
jgi:hypothetical protein